MKTRWNVRTLGGWLALAALWAAASPVGAREIVLQVVIPPGNQACTSELTALHAARATLSVAGSAPLHEPLLLRVFGRARGEGSLRPVFSSVLTPAFAEREDFPRVELSRAGGDDALFPGPFRACLLNSQFNRAHIRVRLTLESD